MKTLIRRFKQYRCGHFHARYTFAGYHTAYRNQSSSVFDVVYIKEKAVCPTCNKNLFRIAAAPPKLTELFFANFDACTAEDPAVIANISSK
jgi:hypothetical protein